MTDDQAEDGGLALDRDRVVVDLRHCRFPDVCLITNQPIVGGPLPVWFYSWKFALPAPGMESEIKDIARSEWTIGPMRILAIKVPIPLQPQFAQRPRGWGVTLLVLGIVTATVGTLLSLLAVFVWQWPALVVVVPLISGIASILAGASTLAKRNAPLVIRRFEGSFIWLAGVHPGVCDGLPLWQNSPNQKSHARRVTRAQLGLGAVTLLVGLLLLVSRFQDMLDAIASRDWPTAPGTIASSQVVAASSRRGNPRSSQEEFEIHMEYVFHVDGVRYTGSRSGFRGPPRSASRQTASDRLRRDYAPGREVTVYYRPTDPARCTMSPGTFVEILVAIAPVLLALSLGSGLLVSGVVKEWNNRSSGNAAEVA